MSSSLFAFPKRRVLHQSIVSSSSDKSVEVYIIRRVSKVMNDDVFRIGMVFLDFFISFFPFFCREKDLSLSLSLSLSLVIIRGVKRSYSLLGSKRPHTHKKKREEEEAFRRL